VAEAQQQQQQGGEGQGIRMPEVNYSTAAQDDYAYETKPLPKRAFDTIGGTSSGQQTQQGGMSSQFETVSSPLNKNI
jgi:hypothetical protein